MWHTGSAGDHDGPDDEFLRRAGLPDTDGEVVLTPRGGGAGWLTVVVRCPELGVEESATGPDGTAVRAAAAGVVELWPWTPSSRCEPEPPPPPDLPPGSWFRGP